MIKPLEIRGKKHIGISHVGFNCPACQKRLGTLQADAGKFYRCQHCLTSFIAPDDISKGKQSGAPGIEVNKNILGQHYVSYNCPKCNDRLRSSLNDAGQTDTCPDCSETFVIPGAEDREWVAIEKLEERERVAAEKRQKKVAAQHQKGVRRGKKERGVRSWVGKTAKDLAICFVGFIVIAAGWVALSFLWVFGLGVGDSDSGSIGGKSYSNSSRSPVHAPSSRPPSEEELKRKALYKLRTQDPGYRRMLRKAPRVVGNTVYIEYWNGFGNAAEFQYNWREGGMSTSSSISY